MKGPRQLALDLPHRPALGREDFLVSQSNAQAVAVIDAWPAWPQGELLLVGPSGSGKSHLVEVWRARSGAAWVAASELAVEAVSDLAAEGAVAVEEAGPGLNEAALFHLVNALAAVRGHLLIAARRPPAAWGLALADLTSRLNRMTVATLAAPDDALMEAVMVKLFADRQLEVAPAVVQFLLRRLERSFAAMNAAVARLDRLAIEERRRVSRALAQRVVAEMAEDAG